MLKLIILPTLIQNLPFGSAHKINYSQWPGKCLIFGNLIFLFNC